MKQMTHNEACAVIHRLYIEWVGHPQPGNPLDTSRIQRSIQQEMRFNKQFPGRASAANKRETRGKLILLGKALAAIKRES